MENLPISLVTVTYNSAQYLEATIKSVLAQNYPNLEYIIIDGASTDGTVDIIRKYEKHLAYWVSEPDGSMYEALQKGFDRSTGDVMAWLNSSDMYPNWTLHTVNAIFNDIPHAEWITSIRPLLWNMQGYATDCMALPGYSRAGFMRSEHSILTDTFTIEVIQQESTFWRRSLWERAGSRIDLGFPLAGDYELWARFYQHAKLYGVRTVLGGFRVHSGQLSQQRDKWKAEVHQIHDHYGVKSHSAFGNYLRRNIAPYLPRRLAHQLGIAHRTEIIVYSQHDNQWHTREVYI